MKKLKIKLFSIIVTFLLLTGTFMSPSIVNNADAVEPWDVTGNYKVSFQLNGDPTSYVHDASFTQTGSSVAAGSGGYPAGGPYTYHWNVTSGTVSANAISLTIAYDLGAVGTTMNMTGVIASNGTMSGTWNDNFGGPTREGTWSTTEGAAVRILPEQCDGMTFPKAQIMGTNGSDSIMGTPGNDVIFAMGGSDIVDGKGGDDCIVGGDGSDRLLGGNGSDVILGGAQGDSINGGNQNDKLYGESGSDVVNGGDGSDIISGGDEADALYGDNGADTIYGDSGNDFLHGGNANDFLTGGDGVDVAQGNNGTFDTCDAESENTCEI